MKYQPVLLRALCCLGLACVAPACDDDDDDELLPTITELAASNPDLSTLSSLLGATGLDQTLSGAGPFTVFAPTDAAFEAFETANPGVLESLTTDQVEDVLLYHVVSGEVFSSDLADGDTPTTLEGSTVLIGVDGGITVNSANVVVADVRARNGVVHVIDAVLVPPALDP